MGFVLLIVGVLLCVLELVYRNPPHIKEVPAGHLTPPDHLLLRLFSPIGGTLVVIGCYLVALDHPIMLWGAGVPAATIFVVWRVLKVIEHSRKNKI